MTLQFTKAQLRSFGSTSQRAADLRRRGFVVMEIDGVIARFAGRGKTFPSASMRKRLGPLLTLGGLYLARCRRRLKKGMPATQARPYDFQPTPGARGYVVSSLYAKRSKARGDIRSASSAEFHRKAQARPGIVTGALVNSLQARTSGSSSVMFDAQGSSIGSTTRIRHIAAGARGNRRGKAAKLKAGRLVRNQWKLNAVWKHLRVNMLQPTDAEVQAIASSIGSGLHREFFRTMGAQNATALVRGVDQDLQRGTDRDFYARLQRRWLQAL